MKQTLKIFEVPIFVLGTIVLFFIFSGLIKKSEILQANPAYIYLWVGILVGSFKLLSETFHTLKKGSFALDYIAILAIITGLYTQNYLVASVIVLMMSSGNSLEEYATKKASDSLKELENRIPNEVLVEMSTGTREKVKIDEVELGSLVVVRKGEVIPLDGVLESNKSDFDESSLTGEALPVTKSKGELVKSGTINLGELILIRSVVIDKDSTFKKIVKLVNEAQSKKAPFIQLADRMSGWFTVLTLVIAGFGYFYLGGIGGLLSVLVIATPCPLLLAVPIAMLGGVSSAAKQRIVFRKLSALEVMSRVTAMIFDKTGTLTLGAPVLKKVEIINKSYSLEKILGISSALERNSFHPYAKAIINYVDDKNIKPFLMDGIEEQAGVGLTGVYEGKCYKIERGSSQNYSSATMLCDGKAVCEFIFEDEVKESSFTVLNKLLNSNLKLAIFTGDTKQRTLEMLKSVSNKVDITADCSPTDKLEGVKAFKEKGFVTAMIGDGINDAPALALSDVGIVFSHQEQTAATEASDIVLLNGNLDSVLKTFSISKRTMSIAKQSMFIGVGLSVIGMIFASLGYVPPLYGAVIQEVIDVAVIINALRASRS